MDARAEELLEDEQLLVWRRRYREARIAGLEHLDACLFAQADTDIGQLRRLVEKGCRPGLIAKILL